MDEIKEIEGSVALFIDSNQTIIEIHDNNTSLILCRVTLTHEQTVKALSRLSHTNCKKIEIYNLENKGKVHENKKFEFKLPNDTNWENKEIIAENLIKEICPDGWTPDIYFNSNTSFFNKRDEKWAQCTIRRWA